MFKFIISSFFCLLLSIQSLSSTALLPKDYPYNAVSPANLQEWLDSPLDITSSTYVIEDWSYPGIYIFGSDEELDTTEDIKEALLPHGFDGSYSFLSNFYPCTFQDVEGYIYQTTEHYYQSHKFPVGSDPFIEVLAASSPAEAKTIARHYNETYPKKYPLPPTEILINNMKEALWHKFVRDDVGPTELGQKLIETQDWLIVEGNKRVPFADSRWGCEFDFSEGYSHVTLTGENRLGRLLMEVRSYLLKF